MMTASRVDSGARLRAMCADILRDDRDYPIVGLSCCAGASDPALAVERVRDVVGPDIPVYVIEPQQARECKTLLPDRLDLFGGAARVWWPGVNDGSERFHPLIRDGSAGYREQALERLAQEFEIDCAQPVRPLPRQLLPQQRLRGPGVRGCRELEAQVNGLERSVRELDRRRVASTRPALAGEHSQAHGVSSAAKDRPAAAAPRPRTRAEQLHLLIVEQWLESCDSSQERAQRPLARYTFSERFERALDRQPRPALEKLAWVCAIVASGVAAKSYGITPQPLLAGLGGAQIMRADGAKAWSCCLQRNIADGPLLHFWMHPSGLIEFEALGYHGRPGRLSASI
jgi:hypothetical protein